MRIHEAVEQAMVEGKCITVPEFREMAKIKPSNERGNCIVMGTDGSHPSEHGWQTKAQDLLRDDWEIVD